MADREHKGLIARWLEGKERSEEYARSTLPTNRWSLFWDILKGRLGKLILINLLVLVTFAPLLAVLVLRYLSLLGNGVTGPFGAGLGIGYPVIPEITGSAELLILQIDNVYYALLIPAAFIAALGLSGGMYIIRNMLWTEGIFFANDFARGIRRNYWNVLESTLILTVLFYVTTSMSNLADLYTALGAQGQGWFIAGKIAGYVILVLAVLVCMWMLTLGVNYKQGPWALFRNAFIMTIATFPQTVFFALIALLPVILIISGVQFLIAFGIIWMLLLGFSYAMLVWMDYCQWAFDKFVNPKLGNVPIGKGLYKKDGKKDGEASTQRALEESKAMAEYRRMIVAQGKSKLVSRPIKPIDDGMEVYQLPESFSRDDLRRLKESKAAIEEDVKAYEAEHENEERYVEYNKQFEEREKALREEDEGKKKKKARPPKMLNKRK